MSRIVEFFFDYGSPTAYLAYRRLPGIAAKHGATIRYRPFLLGGIFKIAGTHSPVESPVKAAWMLQDLKRFADRHGIVFEFNPHFPINTLALMRGAVFADKESELSAYSECMFAAMWRDQRNMGDVATIGKVLATAGLDPKRYMAAIDDPAIKEGLKANTEEAARRGAFGAPTFFVGDEMHFGQDRLDFVEEALARAG